MEISEVKTKYLEFFKAKGHVEVPSASLVPENDPTTLFTGSGMQPMLSYFLGEKHPLGTRITDSQKCFRAEDIDEVGDNRHTTFFEMLGNWSFGDYWKEEQLNWFFEFLTDQKQIGLDPSRLYVSVFSGDSETGIQKDQESIEIWQKIFAKKGISAKEAEFGTVEQGSEVGMREGERIFGYGVKKNWWSRSGPPSNMPAGEPGGPDSEVFYDFGTPHDSKFGKECHPNCDCGRFMEIGNSVFMEYKKREDGAFEKLTQRNVDFGGGLERITAASNSNADIFKINVFVQIIFSLENFFNKKYESSEITRRAYRIIADHIRAAVFLIGDDVLPSNKDRGYILRRLIRRAAFEGYRLAGNIDARWIADVVLPNLIPSYHLLYKKLDEKELFIREELAKETSRFYSTLEAGLKIFEKIAENGNKTITGEEAFMLFTTYGFPVELTKEKAIEKGMDVDEKGFHREFEKHQELSRTASAGGFKGGLADNSEKVTRLHTATHLMNAALRRVLGEHVMQRGSNITGERTRFDFSHPDKMTDEQKAQVEKLVNSWIEGNYEVKKEIMPLEEARKLGAVGAFGEKYSDMVSVYTVWNPETKEIVSREFCGGPHVTHTGEIGKFKILKEEAVGAGVRRIRATVE